MSYGKLGRRVNCISFFPKICCTVGWRITKASMRIITCKNNINEIPRLKAGPGVKNNGLQRFWKGQMCWYFANYNVERHSNISLLRWNFKFRFKCLQTMSFEKGIMLTTPLRVLSAMKLSRCHSFTSKNKRLMSIFERDLSKDVCIERVCASKQASKDRRVLIHPF